MTYRKKTNPVPWIAAIVLLAAFVGLVLTFTGEDDAKTTAPPVAQNWRPSEPAPISYEPPVEQSYEAPKPPPKPELSAAQAEKNLRAATLEWRAFAVEHCRNQGWKTPRAVAFLEKTTWNDRDLEKQHANGLASIQTMLGMETTDPVALAKALDEKGERGTFFEQNWSKLDTPEVADSQAVVALDDRWKPNRIRWGFPLDTPIETLQEFKRVGLAMSLQLWQAMAGQHVQALEIEDEAKMPKFRAAVGEGIREKEAKMHAALRVLLEMPEASLREVVEELVRKSTELKEELAKSLVDKLDAAIQAAEKAEEAT